MAVVGAAVLGAVGLSGCTHPPATAKAPPASTTTAPGVPTSTMMTTTSAPASGSQCETLPTAPAASAQAAGLQPLLITLADLPSGYGAAPSAIIGAVGQFNGAVPGAVPIAGVDFNDTGNPGSYHELANFGNGVDEALGETTSTESAVRLAAKLAAIDAQCHPGPTIDLPGTVPDAVARETSGTSSDTSYAYAITYLTKGPYVVQLTWGFVELLGATAVYALPSPTSMAQQVDGALAHLPS